MENISYQPRYEHLSELGTTKVGSMTINATVNDKDAPKHKKKFYYLPVLLILLLSIINTCFLIAIHVRSGKSESKCTARNNISDIGKNKNKDNSVPGCPDGFIYMNESKTCMHLYAEAVSYPKALEYCRTKTSNGRARLAVLDTKAIEEQASIAFASRIANCPYRLLYLGMMRRDLSCAPGEFFWVDWDSNLDKPEYNHSSFSTGEPACTWGEQCVAIAYRGEVWRKWFDIWCTSAVCSICEIEPEM